MIVSSCRIVTSTSSGPIRVAKKVGVGQKFVKRSKSIATERTLAEVTVSAARIAEFMTHMPGM